MMRELSPYSVLQDEVDRIAGDVSDPETHEFNEFFVRATTVLAAYGDSNQGRNATFCAHALRSWSEEDRADYLTQVDVPGRVLQQLVTTPDPWPLSEATPDDEPETPPSDD